MLSIKLCSMFNSRGHIVYFYGIKNADVKVSKIIPVVDINNYNELKKESNNFVDPRYMRPDIDIYKKLKYDIITKFSNNLRSKLNIHYTDGDVVLHVGNTFNSKWFIKEMIHIDASAMGGCIFQNNVVFITEPWRYNIENVDTDCIKEKITNSTVILPWFNPNNFNYNNFENGNKLEDNKSKEIYLYLARCSKVKGLIIYLILAKKFPNRTFWIAGNAVSYNSNTNILVDDENVSHNLNDYPNVKYWGVADINLKRKLLNSASLLIQPTLYYEPCGWNVIEAMLSGTPVIAPNKGGFSQTIIDKVTGYLYNNVSDISEILENKLYENLNSKQIREYAQNTFSEDRAYRQYIEFFDKITKNSN